jgi:hypothetical protein
VVEREPTVVEKMVPEEGVVETPTPKTVDRKALLDWHVKNVEGLLKQQERK